MIKAIIFDYDGVIAESVQVKTEAFAELYRPFGSEIVNKVILHHEANGGISRFEKFKMYHEQYLNIPLDEKGIDRLAQEFSDIILKKVIDSPYIRGAEDFLKTWHTKYDLFISTGTPESEIKTILKTKDIYKYFKAVYGSPESKGIHIQRIITAHAYKNGEMVFVGDATTDRDAARQAGIEFIGRYTTVDEIKNEKLKIEDFTTLKGIIENI
ncbi:MAG: HAD-IA family hydrolase [Candidatus Marinimicrobia bacterium]|nr:HAD-IA family hydrolase [Candidatus Neomarinimicrobiota bacterium]